MNIELVLQAQDLFNKLDKLCWHYAQQQDESNYKRVRRIAGKTLDRYERRYKAFNSRGSTKTST